MLLTETVRGEVPRSLRPRARSCFLGPPTENPGSFLGPEMLVTGGCDVCFICDLFESLGLKKPWGVPRPVYSFVRQRNGGREVSFFPEHVKEQCGAKRSSWLRNMWSNLWEAASRLLGRTVLDHHTLTSSLSVCIGLYRVYHYSCKCSVRSVQCQNT